MAVKAFLVANPTGVDVTTNAKTALARRVTALNFDDAALVNGLTDLAVFFTAGCAVAPSDAGGSSVEKREQIGFLFEMEEHDTA